MPLLKKLLLFIVIVLIYFLGIRNLRAVVHDLHFGSVLPDTYGLVGESTNLTFYSQSTVSYTFVYQPDETEYIWIYKIPFDSFFLFAMLGLVFLNAKKDDYLILTGIHFTSGLISLLFLVLGIHFQHYLLLVPDLLSRYLVPLCSLGMVGLAYLKNKGKLE